MCLYTSCLTIFRLLCNLSNYFKWFCNVMLTGTAIISLLKMTCPEFPAVVHRPHMRVEVRFCGMPSEGTLSPPPQTSSVRPYKGRNPLELLENHSQALCSPLLKCCRHCWTADTLQSDTKRCPLCIAPSSGPLPSTYDRNPAESRRNVHMSLSDWTGTPYSQPEKDRENMKDRKQYGRTRV